MFKQKHHSVASIYLGHTKSHGAVVTNRDGRFIVDNIETYANNINTDLIDNTDVDELAIAVGPSHSLCFPINDFQSNNAEQLQSLLNIERSTYNIGDNQYHDYIVNDGSGYLAEIQKEVADSLIAYFQEQYPRINHFNIANAIIGPHYLYTRAFKPSPELRAAFVHISGEYILLAILQGMRPRWINIMPIKPNVETTCAEIDVQLQIGADKVSSADNSHSQPSSYIATTGREEIVLNNNDSLGIKISRMRCELLLVYGECEKEYLDEIIAKLNKQFKSVRALNPFEADVVELAEDSQRMSAQKRDELKKNMHKYVVPISMAGLRLEKAGMNLSATEVEMWREFPKERSFSQDIPEQSQTLAALMGNTKQIAQTVLPMLKAQSTILLLAVLCAVILPGYQYWSLQREHAVVAQDKTREESRAAQLADVRKKHELYKSQIAIIEERINAINTIRSEQLTVKTVFDRLDERIPPGLIFSEMEVNNRDLKINGYAPDRLAVTTFATRLGQSIGIFSDVAPIYDDKTNTGNYQISCKYVGPVEINPIPVPTVSNVITALKQEKGR